MPIILSLESLIGGGKTTFLTLLKEKYGNKLHIVKEPVDEWQDVNGMNLLDLFYKDQKKYSYMFQTYGLITRVRKLERKLKEVADDAIVIVERSWFTDKNTFARVLYEDGKLSEIQWQMYCEYFDWACERVPIINAYIYLKTSVDVAIERIAKRDRSEESGLPKDYLEKLNEKHDGWLLKAKNVIVLDGDVEFETNPDMFDKMCNKIEKYL